MSEKRQWRRSAVLGSLAVLAAAGCASMEAPKMTSAQAIAARQQLMKDQGAAMRSIQEKLKAGQVQAIVPEAETLARTSKEMLKMFPEGSVDPAVSRAKPEIWQKWPEFEGYAKSLDTKATQLIATARTGNAQATGAAVTDLGKTTCGACHNAFRGPEIKK
jgi:cytochrome c556